MVTQINVGTALMGRIETFATCGAALESLPDPA